VHDPLLVLADEPTGNLDLETGRQVLDLLDRLTRRAGKTMVMVTHSPDVVGLADRMFAIEHGQLVERPPTNPMRLTPRNA
jgi:putative ABC transport system ATP-binding protein